MRKIAILLLAATLPLSAFAQKPKLNDYSMLGANYGVAFTMARYKPQQAQNMVFQPQYISILYTNYNTFLERFPNFGIVTGLEYVHEGYKLTKINEHAEITAFHIPLMCQFHFDTKYFKFMANLGGYGGYRKDFTRTDTSSVAVRLRKGEYGVMGGVGFALVFDPVEIQINALGKLSFAPMFSPSAYDRYVYKYVYPIDIIISAGVHFHFGRRYGKTIKALKQEAREAVMKEYEDSKSIDRPKQ